MKLDLKALSKVLDEMVNPSTPKLTDSLDSTDPLVEQEVENLYSYVLIDAGELGLEELENALAADASAILEAVLHNHFYDDGFLWQRIVKGADAQQEMDNLDKNAAILDQWYITHTRRIDTMFDFLTALRPAKMSEVKYSQGFALLEMVEENDIVDDEEADDDTVEAVDSDEE